MLGSATLATVLSGRGKVADVVAFAVANDVHVVLDAPGTKVPLCILGARKRKEADLAAVDVAMAAGRPRPEQARHDCGVHHVLGPADKDGVRALVARLERTYGDTLNVGVEPGRSRLVVVDVDTAEENAAFRGWLADHKALGPQMTVRSPGKRDTTGAMVHADGGHYWFELPAGAELPTGPDTGVMKVAHGDSSFTVMWANRQVLIPPSVRSEGAYVATGAPVTVLPVALLTMITDYTASRANAASVRLAERGELEASDIDSWDARTPWANLLEPDGWIDTGLVDRSCGCPIWTAPGPHGSPKSATAHDLGCARFDTEQGWGPLHIWTDNPPEQLTGHKTWTKLAYLAAMAGVERSEMMVTLGITDAPPDVSFEVEFERPWTDDAALATVTESVTSQVEAVTTSVTEIFSDPLPSDSVESVIIDKQNESDNRESWQKLLDSFMDQQALNTLPDPEPLIDGILDRDTLARMVGKPGSGKTFLALDMACCVATGKPFGQHQVRQAGLVVYLVAEGASGWKTRLNAWTAVHNEGVPLTREQLLVIPFAIQAADKESWLDLRKALKTLCPMLVVFDTQARITVGIEENSASDMGKFIHELDKIRTDNNRATVLLVHHLGHNGDQGRGSSSVLGALHTELRVVDAGNADDGRKIVRLHVDKQKDDVEQPPEDSLITRLDGSFERPPAYLVHCDPFDDPTPITERLDDVRHVPERCGLYVYLGALIADALDGPEEGWTRSDALAMLTGKRWANRDITAEAKRTAWKRLRERNWVEPLEDGKVQRWVFVGRDGLENTIAESDK